MAAYDGDTAKSWKRKIDANNCDTDFFSVNRKQFDLIINLSLEAFDTFALLLASVRMVVR